MGDSRRLRFPLIPPRVSRDSLLSLTQTKTDDVIRERHKMKKRRHRSRIYQGMELIGRLKTTEKPKSRKRQYSTQL